MEVTAWSGLWGKRTSRLKSASGLSVGHFVAALEAFHPTCGVHYLLLPGEERMALAAQLHLKQLLGRAGGKGVATGADHLGIGVVLRMYLILHLASSG